jgi:hypothetical protein
LISGVHGTRTANARLVSAPCQRPAKRIDADTLLDWSERILSAGRIEGIFR